jgi:anti-sigma factor ChrR (cupin superfamily)
MTTIALLMFFVGAEPIQIDADGVVWADAPASMPKGTKMAILEGDPKKEGIFTIRLKAPPGFELPVHTHPADERVTVLAGSIAVGFGKTMDKSRGRVFKAGAFYVNPTPTPHFVWSDEGCVVQITGVGPWRVDPAPPSL